ncbi:MAG TPA: hypothetical protein DHV90_09025 [Lactobacillus sp.]|nr:hypothetical protein [Lactobacillus sp.]
MSTGHFKNGVRGPESRQKPGERCDFCLPPGRNSARVVSKVDKKWGKGVIFVYRLGEIRLAWSQK